MEMQVWALERVGEAADRCPTAVAEALAELAVTIPSDAPPELVALTACAAALPEKSQLQPDMRGLARGLVEAWKGEKVQDEAILEALWEVLEFSVFALSGRGFREWARYRQAADAAKTRHEATTRAAQNRAWAYGVSGSVI